MNRLKELRTKKGLTLQELSKEVNISFGALGNYENERREPKLATWQKLADYFGVSVGYLQGVTDYPSTEMPPIFDDDKEIYDENGNFTPELKAHFKKVNAVHNGNTSNNLSHRLHELFTYELLTDEDGESVELANNIDDNLSNISDRLLVSDLLDGVNAGIASVLLTDIGLKKHRNDLKNVAIKIDELNDYLNDLSNNDLKKNDTD